MDNTIKSINFANDTEDHQRTERISPELVNGYRPEYAPILENIVPLFTKVEYGFNDTLSDYFYGSRPFLFPMPGTGKVTTEIIRKSMMELKDYLKK